MTARSSPDAVVMAIWRGAHQHISEQFQRLMADHGVVCSMSRSGNVWDNAAMESFFSSLKTERTARKMYRTRDDAKADWRRTTSCCAGISIHSAASPEAIAIFSRAAGSFRYGDRACPGLDAGRRASLHGGLRLLTRSVFGCGVDFISGGWCG